LKNEKIDNLNIKINYNNTIIMDDNNTIVIEDLNEILSIPIDELTCLHYLTFGRHLNQPLTNSLN
jgi:hypothetical protein